MKRLVLLPIFLLFVLAAFFSCTKDAPAPNAESANQSHILSMTKGEDGILNLTIAVEPTTVDAVGERDGDCPLYEAMRFFEIENDPPECDDTRVYVNVKFRLIKMHKQTLARTALTQYQDISNVGGLNITWYPYSPLSDYWYAVEFDKCERNASSLPSGTGIDDEFWIYDFWGDDGQGTHLDPCGSSDVGGYGKGPFNGVDPDELFTQCTLNEECIITP